MENNKLSDVKRHSVSGYGRQDINYNDPEGEFVYYEDYAALQQKLDTADNLANLRGAMINDLLRTGMPESIAAIIDSGDLEAICYGHEYPGAEKHRMALFNFRMARRSEAREVSDLIRSGTHDTADKAG
ncbi:hypothetical protein [Pantoea ananatis]|uniref:hypothetical protein n=1 Tax=Pantoea ananas TaxID=553 RepID=UPI001FF0A634|nr:hypothetical protein [Pantoea ananatis]